MQDTTSNGAPPVPAGTVNGQGNVFAHATAFAPGRIREIVAALEEPFEPSEIKWRVTNTCKVGGRNGPRDRGQMLAYADPRAYADRLNTVLGPSGWTRDYAVQMVQNFERKERGTSERTITAKIIVTCRLTIHGFGAHSGLGEEWADNENAGTAAEAQSFKRACSCFGLGRYLYDLEGQWVDLDEKKRPLETPRLPDWALPNRGRVAEKEIANGTPRHLNGQRGHNGQSQAGGRNGFYRDEVLGQVNALCATVGFSLSQGILRAIAKVNDPSKIRNMAKLTGVFEKLQDTARGIERLRAAISKAGEQRYSVLCRELGLASESVDDIPDRAVLRRLVEALERGSGPSEVATDANGKGARTESGTSGVSELRGAVLQEANRVSGESRRSLADVINEAAKGTFTFSTLRTLSDADAANLRAALNTLKAMRTTA
ncbi:MAG: hypothetical protein K2X03_02460 [Bryobacteraceae bacterium]|nr:hypothetical protein [Bryobacteraceae bacterium]